MLSHESDVKVIQNSELDLSLYNKSADALVTQLVQECSAMVQYALSNALEVDAEYVNKFYQIMEHDKFSNSHEEIKQLAEIHQILKKTIYPATPRSITLLALQMQLQPALYFLGPVPLIRRLSAVAILFLIMLLVTALQKDVNIENIQLGLLHSEDNILLLNQAFLLCAAGLGASFSALFLANSYIAKATYDPRYDSSYWSSIILGIIAGIIIVELLPSSLFQEGAMRNFGKPSLAMLGGFSSKVVYGILQRVVDSLETLVKGTNTNKMEHEKALLKAQTSEQKSQISSETASKLIHLISNLDGLDSHAIKQKLNEFIDEILPGHEHN